MEKQKHVLSVIEKQLESEKIKLLEYDERQQEVEKKKRIIEKINEN